MKKVERCTEYTYIGSKTQSTADLINNPIKKQRLDNELATNIEEKTEYSINPPIKPQILPNYSIINLNNFKEKFNHIQSDSSNCPSTSGNTPPQKNIATNLEIRSNCINNLNSIFAEEFYPKNTFKNYGKLYYFSNLFIFFRKRIIRI